LFDSHGEAVGVLDVDSDELDDFSRVDAAGLEKIGKILESKF
jgi:putative methionine-R-sulfoxide reductase with GAF domain